MRLAIDAERHAADDREPRFAQRTRKGPRILQALGRRVAAADDRKRRRRKKHGVSVDVDERGRIGYFQDLSGISGVGERKYRATPALRPADGLLHFGLPAPLEDSRRQGFGYDARELRASRADYVRRQAERREQGAKPAA